MCELYTSWGRKRAADMEMCPEICVLAPGKVGARCAGVAHKALLLGREKDLVRTSKQDSLEALWTVLVLGCDDMGGRWMWGG